MRAHPVRGGGANDLRSRWLDRSMACRDMFVGRLRVDDHGDDVEDLRADKG